MLRASLLLVVVLGACATDAQQPPSLSAGTMEGETVRTTTLGDGKGDKSDRPDVCALAAALPDDDICRLVCDPDALAAQLAADGAEAGACYSLLCALTDTEHVIVGVCLAPE